ncbi:MAG TPA: alpha/beta fold hydrolase [Stellaceae bacterium]|jgi:homoserine O-acetyltransferase|nr:alpha/beta fold hydrolase [Stellaceae bacterium]
MLIRAVLIAALIAGGATAALAADTSSLPNFQEGDYVVKNYAFVSGETLPEVKLHYRTMGTAKRNAAGEIVNGVLLLQGNTGTGANWLRPSIADEVFKPGQPLDPAQYFIIMPDALGRGGSSKPSDGLKGKFPHYRYHDMVDLTHKLITDGLKVAHLRLVIGSSLGCMQQFLWAETYPDLMDGTVGMSCQPIEISGRNYMLRHAAAENIRHDPDWNNGNYDKNPSHYEYSAAGQFMTESPVRIQEMAPTREAAKALYDKRLAEAMKGDANNTLWEIESIEDYSPEADLPKIKAKVLLINNVEDFADPPDLGTVERAMKKIKYSKYVLTPYSKETHGHFTHYYAAIWKPYLVAFMKTLGPVKAAAN